MESYRCLSDFLIKQRTHDKKLITHTRIGDGKNIIPCKYYIPDEKLELFYKLYHRHVFRDGKNEYLTEKQKSDNTPILIDFDFRYNSEIQERQHNEEHIQDIVSLYIDTIRNEVIEDTNLKNIDVYVFEKPNINTWEKEGITKDGIHIVIPIHVPHQQQLFLREKVKKQLEQDIFCDLPLTNTIEDILDIGISKGCINWMLFGSRKPNHEQYNLTYYYKSIIDDDGECLIEKQDIQDITEYEILKKCSARQVEKIPVYSFSQQAKEYVIKEKKKSKILNKKTSNTDNYECDEEYVNKFWDYVKSCIPLDYFGDYHKFFEFFCIHKNIIGEKNYNELDEFMKNTNGYNEIGNKIIYEEKINIDRDIKVGWSRLYEICNKCNSTEKHKLDEKYDDNKLNIKKILKLLERGNESDLANIFVNEFGDKFIYRKEVLYFYNGVYWEKNETKHLLRKYISNQFVKKLEKFNQYYVKQKSNLIIENEENNQNQILSLTENITKINILINKCGSTTFKQNLQKEIIDLITDNTIKFEINTHLFAFNNKVYDLDKDEFIEPHPKQYITLTTGYDYKEATNEKKQELMRIISTILPKEDVRKFYFCCLASALYGEPLQKWIVCYGCGRNGKGMLNDLFLTMMGKYGTQLNSNVLTKPIDDGVNQQVANLNHIRFVITREPAGTAINNATIRQLTGGGTISVAGKYDKDTSKILRLSLFMEANDMIEYKSKIEEADIARLVGVPFNSRFTDDETRINEEEHIYAMNLDYATDKFREEMKYALFSLMIEVNKIYKSYNKKLKSIEPVEVKEMSKKYLTSCDKILSWCNDRFIKLSNDTIKKRVQNKEVCWIKLKDVYTIFKNSELYSLLSKKDKRTIGTKKALIDYISKSHAYCNDYIKKRDFYNKKYRERTIIYGYDFVNIENENDSDEEEDEIKDNDEF